MLVRRGMVVFAGGAALAFAAGAAASPLQPAAHRAPARIGFEAERVGQGVMLRWVAASEAQIRGYNVYRRVGHLRVRVNDVLIPAANDPRGHVYRWLDRTSNHREWYWLQVVDAAGARTWRAATIAH
jgi:hypothetical protein